MYPLSPRTEFSKKLIALDLRTPYITTITNTFNSNNNNFINPKTIQLTPITILLIINMS